MISAYLTESFHSRFTLVPVFSRIRSWSFRVPERTIRSPTSSDKRPCPWHPLTNHRIFMDPRSVKFADRRLLTLPCNQFGSPPRFPGRRPPGTPFVIDRGVRGRLVIRRWKISCFDYIFCGYTSPSIIRVPRFSISIQHFGKLLPSIYPH